ncbi:DUF4229 domain-containing protein [Agromyces tardus]|jgi:hypothetical protein|nr:DUF4229 domain-containing protein [Agromyces tardus]
MVRSAPTWLRYTLLRVLLFAAPLAVLLIAGVDPWISVIVAALFGFSSSLVFLRGMRERLSEELYAARHREQPVVRDDDLAEDAAVDAAADAAPVAEPAPAEPSRERQAPPAA